MFTSILSFLSPYKLLIKGIALVLMVISLYAYYVHFKHSLIAIGEHNIQVKFDKYIKEQEALVLVANAKNTVLRNEADKKLADLKLNYDKNLAELNIDNVKLKKDLKDALPRIASLLADAKLYKNRSATSISTVSKDALTTELSTEGGRDCNGTIAIVTQAGQSCALDYDALYNAWMTECKAMGGCI